MEQETEHNDEEEEIASLSVMASGSVMKVAAIRLRLDKLVDDVNNHKQAVICFEAYKSFLNILFATN